MHWKLTSKEDTFVSLSESQQGDRAAKVQIETASSSTQIYQENHLQASLVDDAWMTAGLRPFRTPT